MNIPAYAKNPVNWLVIGVLAFAGVKAINFALTKAGADQYRV